MKLFRNVLIVLMSYQMLYAVDMTVEKKLYHVDEVIQLALKEKPNNDQDWIGIFKKDEPSIWKNVVQWKWVTSASFYEFKGLKSGVYEARFFPKNSYKLEASVVFSVQEALEISSKKDVYQTNELVWVKLKNKPNNDQDWLGIFKKGEPSIWKNVVQWQWVTSKSSYQFKGLELGEYEARFFPKNSYDVHGSVNFSVEPVKKSKQVQATELNGTGRLFASVDGEGDCLSETSPCSLQSAIHKLQAGTVLFLRGGVYTLRKGIDIAQSGTAQKPIIVESYPEEKAILDGGNRSPKDVRTRKNFTRFGIRLDHAEHVKIRNLEITGMSLAGIVVSGQHNVIEGCKVHGNFLVGIQLNNNGAFNTIRHNSVHHNSDVGLYPKDDRSGFKQYNNGGNADGIQVVDGNNHRIYHNLVFENSDDGIDTWKSDDTEVKFNIVHHNGLGEGNGNGIKAGGNGQGENAIIEHNIAYENKARGFDYNRGINVSFRYNTSFKNHIGFTGSDSTVCECNIAQDNGIDVSSSGEQIANSWQMDAEVKFISSDPNSKDFLRPVKGSSFEDIGAYASF